MRRLWIHQNTNRFHVAAIKVLTDSVSVKEIFQRVADAGVYD